METTKTYTSASPEIQRLADIVMYVQRNLIVSTTEKVSERKLSIPQYTLLGFLSVSDSLNMGKLATLMGHTTPATTGLVDRLALAMLVERYTIASDRRQVLVRITPKGRSLVEEMKADVAECLSKIMTLLQPADQAAWLRIYEIVYQYCSTKKNPDDK